MADSLANFNHQIHRANCAELLSVLTLLQTFIAANPTLEQQAQNGPLREYNKRRFTFCLSS